MQESLGAPAFFITEYQIRHAVRLLKKEQNFVFCEWELYDGTAPEQKTESAKSLANSVFARLLNVCFVLILYIINGRSDDAIVNSYLFMARLCPFSTV